ncbi:unnamed protein product [Chrysoparadoxa australica]
MALATAASMIRGVRERDRRDKDATSCHRRLSSKRGVGKLSYQGVGSWARHEVLGRGAYGVVYRGELKSGRMVAVKQIRIDGMGESELKAVENEIRMIQQLAHPNVVSYIGAEQVGDDLNIFLEYAGGGSLRKLLQKTGRMTEEQTAANIKQVLEGLKYLHAKHVTHRDVKGGNILIGTDGTLKLADFGASKRMGHESVLSGLKGTPHWMAPEVIRGQQTAKGWFKADVWSIGCTVVEMLTGEMPWPDIPNPMAAMYRIANGEKPPLKVSVSKEAESFINACCSSDPKHRMNVKQLLSHPFLKKGRNCTVSRPVRSPERSADTRESSKLADERGPIHGGHLEESGELVPPALRLKEERERPPCRAKQQARTPRGSDGPSLSVPGERPLSASGQSLAPSTDSVSSCEEKADESRVRSHRHMNDGHCHESSFSSSCSSTEPAQETPFMQRVRHLSIDAVPMSPSNRPPRSTRSSDNDLIRFAGTPRHTGCASSTPQAKGSASSSVPSTTKADKLISGRGRFFAASSSPTEYCSSPRPSSGANSRDRQASASPLQGTFFGPKGQRRRRSSSLIENDLGSGSSSGYNSPIQVIQAAREAQAAVGKRPSDPMTGEYIKLERRRSKSSAGSASASCPSGMTAAQIREELQSNAPAASSWDGDRIDRRLLRAKSAGVQGSPKLPPLESGEQRLPVRLIASAPTHEPANSVQQRPLKMNRQALQPISSAGAGAVAGADKTGSSTLLRFNPMRHSQSPRPSSALSPRGSKWNGSAMKSV